MQPWQQAKAAARFESSAGFDAAWVASKTDKLLASLHPKQLQFVQDPHRRVSALVGRRGGKTTGMLARFVLRMLHTPRAACVYVALTRPNAEELMWNPLKDLLGKLGVEAVFNETKLRCTIKRNGSVIRLVGADDKKEVEKLRGQKFHEVAIDEAASFNAKLLDNLIDRVIGPALGDYRGCLVMFGTPGHLLQGQFYDATRPGSEYHRAYEDRDLPEYDGWTSWSSHRWTLPDGAPYVKAMANAWAEALVMKADRGWGDDHPVWSREWLGRWAADDTENVFRYRAFLDDGLPWNQWDPERVGQLGFGVLPAGVTDWEYAYGSDMGHADPFALNVFAFSPSDPTRTIYHVLCFERKKMYARTIAQLLLGDELNAEKPRGVIGHTGWPVGMVADLAGLGDAIIDELANVYGIRMAAAEKKNKLSGIELVNGDLIEGRIKILKGSVLEAQLSSLQWAADEFGKLSEKKGEANHSTDCIIYARRLIARLFESGRVAATSPRKVQRDDEPEEPTERKRDDFESLLAPAQYSDGWG